MINRNIWPGERIEMHYRRSNQNRSPVMLRTQEKKRIFEKEVYLVEHLGEDRFKKVAGEIINALEDNSILYSPAYVKELLDYVAETVIYQDLKFTEDSAKGKRLNRDVGKEQSKHVSVKTEPGKITMEIYNPESTVTYHEELTDVNVVWILDGLLKDIASDTIKTMHSSMYDEHTYNTSIKPVFIQALFRAMQIVIAEAGCENELNPAILKDEKSLERFLGSDAV